jgi:hypothetical protein
VHVVIEQRQVNMPAVAYTIWCRHGYAADVEDVTDMTALAGQLFSEG